MGGLDKPATVVMEGELAWENYLLRPWLEQLCYEFHRQGFRAVIMLTGHYGHNQQIVVRETAARMTERLQIAVLGTPEYWLAHEAGYLGDHAGIGETSLLWHLAPELVDIARIREDPEYGATDAIEKAASPQLGQRYAERIETRLAAVARHARLGRADAGGVREGRAGAGIRAGDGLADRGTWAAWRRIASARRTLPATASFWPKAAFPRLRRWRSGFCNDAGKERMAMGKAKACIGISRRDCCS
jgi:creatinine amidohydrolase